MFINLPLQVTLKQSKDSGPSALRTHQQRLCGLSPTNTVLHFKACLWKPPGVSVPCVGLSRLSKLSLLGDSCWCVSPPSRWWEQLKDVSVAANVSLSTRSDTKISPHGTWHTFALTCHTHTTSWYRENPKPHRSTWRDGSGKLMHTRMFI